MVSSRLMSEKKCDQMFWNMISNSYRVLESKKGQAFCRVISYWPQPLGKGHRKVLGSNELIRSGIFYYWFINYRIPSLSVSSPSLAKKPESSRGRVQKRGTDGLLSEDWTRLPQSLMHVKHKRQPQLGFPLQISSTYLHLLECWVKARNLNHLKNWTQKKWQDWLKHETEWLLH